MKKLADITDYNNSEDYLKNKTFDQETFGNIPTYLNDNAADVFICLKENERLLYKKRLKEIEKAMKGWSSDKQ